MNTNAKRSRLRFTGNLPLFLTALILSTTSLATSLTSLKSGKPVETATFKNGTHLIEFWATWCLNCMENIKTLHKFTKETSSKKFQFTAINLDEDKEDVDVFFDEAKLKAFIELKSKAIFDKDQAFAKTLKVEKLPAVLLLKDGKEVGRWEKKLGPKDLKEIEAKL